MAARKFGRIPSGQLARRVPKLRLRSLVEGLGTPPDHMCWTAAVSGPFDVLGNDTVGDCAIVAPAQLARVCSANAGAERKPALDAVLATYSAVSGYKPGDDSTDLGCSMSDVLGRWKNTGLALFDSASADKIIGSVRLNPLDLDELRWAICWFGGIYNGFDLPAAADSDNPKWTLNVPADGLNVLGGHATACCAYGPEGFDQITWGAFRLAEPDFVTRFLSEAYAVVLEDWRLPTGMTPSGLAASDIEDRIKRLAAAAHT